MALVKEADKIHVGQGRITHKTGDTSDGINQIHKEDGAGEPRTTLTMEAPGPGRRQEGSGRPGYRTRIRNSTGGELRDRKVIQTPKFQSNASDVGKMAIISLTAQTTLSVTSVN